MSRAVDVYAACEAFVAVAERESFTTGAAVVGVGQSVASRRVGRLESHLGGRLFQRSTRRVELTELGRAVLPGAVAVVRAFEALQDDADRFRQQPVVLALPETVAADATARLCAAALSEGVPLEVLSAGPPGRSEAYRSRRAELSVEQVPVDAARWTVPLGVGVQPGSTGASRFYLGGLRSALADADRPRRRLWLLPEDDVPSVRDRIEHLRNVNGLVPHQVQLAGSPTRAVAEVLARDDVLLCTAAEAAAYDLDWLVLADQPLARGYQLAARDRDLADRVLAVTGDRLGALLGVTDA